MPISFQPASPFAPNINANFGAADQYNRIYPQLADLYASAGRNITQASAQTAQNFTQGNIASAENQTRRTLQGFQIDAEEMQQRRQIEAQREAQQREQAFELQRMMIPISRQEQMEQIRRIDGMAELDRQYEEGTIDRQQYNDARYQLATRIDQYGNREKMQQTQLDKARESKMLSDMAINESVLGANTDIRAGKQGSIERIVLDPQMEQSARRELAPKLQALTAAMGAAQAKQVIDAEVREMVVQAGGGTREVLDGISADGSNKWRAIESKGKEAKQEEMEDKQFERKLKRYDTEMKVWQHQQDRYDSALERQEMMLRKRFDEKESTKDIPREIITREAKADLEVRGIRPPGNPPEIPVRQSAVPGLPDQQAPINPQAVQQATQAPSAPQPVQQADVPKIENQLRSILKQYPDLEKAPPAIQQEFLRLNEARKAAR